MVVGILVLDVQIPSARSLKDKRQVLRSLLDRSRREFRVAIAEVGDNDLWGNAVVCAACPSSSWVHAQGVLAKVESLFQDCPELVVTAVRSDQWQE